MKRLFVLPGTLILMFLLSLPVYSQSHISTQSHQSDVTAIGILESSANPEGSFFTAGRDGMLVRWTQDGLGEHYQITELELHLAARSPNGSDIAVYETDNLSQHRISVWNWPSLTRRFTHQLDSQVTALSYAPDGSYIIAGTTSVEGTIFLNSSSGNEMNILKEQTGVVSLAQISSSGKTCIMYSPSGTLTYYDMHTGARKARFAVMPGLEQLTLAANNTVICGYRDDTIYIFDAQKNNRQLAAISAQNALITASESETASGDHGLYFFCTEGKSSILKLISADTLHDLILSNNPTVVSPKTEIIHSFSPLAQKDDFVSLAKNSASLILGSKRGNVYVLNTTPDTKTCALIPVTDAMYDHILDISPVESDFYFLTAGSIFRSSYDGGVVTKVGDNKASQNRIITYGNKAILWTKDGITPVQTADFFGVTNGSSSAAAVMPIFTPKNALKTMHLCGDSLIYIEGSSTVCEYDLLTGKIQQLYAGTGLQDAILYNNTDLYIAKSSATNPPSALILENTTTMETVPLNVKGTIIYSLAANSLQPDGSVYGISVTADTEGSTTALFSFSPAQKTTNELCSVSEEDIEAFTLLSYNSIYTDIGKSQIRTFNLNSNRNFVYKRSASLPLKVARNETRIAVLNRDGSISWYNPDFPSVLADWYLTVDGAWFEF